MMIVRRSGNSVEVLLALSKFISIRLLSRQIDTQLEYQKHDANRDIVASFQSHSNGDNGDAFDPRQPQPRRSSWLGVRWRAAIASSKLDGGLLQCRRLAAPEPA